MNTIELARVVRDSLYAPTSWDAWDTQGDYYYLRHRHGRGRIEGEHGHTHFTHELPAEATNKQLLATFLDLANSSPGTQYQWTLARGAELVDYDYTQEERQMTDALAIPTPAAAAVPTPEPAPQPLFKGRVAIFMAPDQSLVITYRRDGETDQKQTVIPGMYLAMAASTVGADPQEMINKMVGL